MNKIKLFRIKNVMLEANWLANFTGAVFVNELLSNVTEYMLPISIVSTVQKFHIVFTTIAFSFAIIFRTIYDNVFSIS